MTNEYLNTHEIVSMTGEMVTTGPDTSGYTLGVWMWGSQTRLEWKERAILGFSGWRGDWLGAFDEYR